jgi:hypothetical protein
MAPYTLHVFNAYDLQEDPYEQDKIDFQEVVNYCEDRFHAALSAIIKESDENQKWMMKVLFRELVRSHFLYPSLHSHVK